MDLCLSSIVYHYKINNNSEEKTIWKIIDVAVNLKLIASMHIIEG